MRASRENLPHSGRAVLFAALLERREVGGVESICDSESHIILAEVALAT